MLTRAVHYLPAALVIVLVAGCPTQKRLGGCHPKIATVQGGRTTHYKLRYRCFYD